MITVRVEHNSSLAASWHALAVGQHSPADLSLHSLTDLDEESGSSTACKAAARMLMLQSQLALLLRSYDPDYTMSSQVEAEFRRLNAELHSVYEILECAPHAG